jgi:hypothetical protein
MAAPFSSAAAYVKHARIPIGSSAPLTFLSELIVPEVIAGASSEVNTPPTDLKFTIAFMLTDFSLVRTLRGTRLFDFRFSARIREWCSLIPTSETG